MKKEIAVIDLKAFYSYVECVDRGLDPWTTPLVVADKSRSENTIVLSVTPFLKKHGVPSRCRIKELPKTFKYIYATPRMERYIEKSSEILSIMMEFVSYEDMHVYSIDESFIDLTSYLNYYHKTSYEIVKWILDTIKERTGLMATAGIGDNFFLAKVALDIFAKKEKDGIATMHIEDVKEKLWPITPLSEIWGIGSHLEARLNKLGIFTVKDLACSDKDFLISKFGVIGEQMFNHANGIDEADLHEEYVPKEKSLSIGQVLFKNYNKDEIITIIREMNDDLALRLRNEKKQTEVVSLFIGYSKAVDGGFSRQMSLLSPTDDQDILFDTLMEIFKKHIEDKLIRHVGINFGKLRKTKYQQFNIFEDEKTQKNKTDLQLTIDEIHNKYGKNMLLRASALTEDSTAIERHSFIGGHKR